MVSAYSIGKAKRSNSLINLCTPGPGTYQLNSSPRKNFQNNYRKTSQSKRLKKDLWIDDAVGPGTYEINKFAKTSKYKGTPQFSFPKSKFLERKGYNGKDTIYYPKKEDVSHKYSFGKQPKIFYPQNPNPGPGSYTLKAPKLKKVAVFGTSEREDIIKKENTPGPGTYKIKILKTTKENKFPASLRPFPLLPSTPSPYPLPSTLSHQAFSFPKTTHESNQRTNGEKPGPSHYALKFDKLFKKSAGFIFDKEEKNVKEKSFGPGPGAYEIKKEKRVKSYKLVKPIKKTNLTDPSMDSPGPGQYKIKEKWNDGPKFIFGEKLDQKEGREDSPGPAEYKIKERTEYPSYSIGKSSKLREENRSKIVPGPGQYYPKDKPSGPFTIFDKAQLLTDEKRNPGPGTYNLKPTFADVPNYLFYNIKKKIEL